MNVYLAQMLCPSRHCILAAANTFESEDEATALVPKLRGEFDKACVTNPKMRICALCGSTDLHIEVGRTRFSTMDEALPALLALQEEQRLTHEWIKAGRN